MKTTDEVISNKKDLMNDSKGINTSADNIFINCEIAKDATKKIDFLILVIETLQINATDSFLLKAKDIGLSDDFSTRVQFWKMRTSNPLRKSYSFSSLSTDQIDSLV